MIVKAGSFLITLLLALPAGADWLVTRDGSRIETRGPWKVKGAQVIFTLPSGTLSALRAADVDLEASEAATTRSLAPPPSAQATEPAAGRAERPKPIMVLNNENIRAAGSVTDDDEGSDGEDEEGEDEEGETDELEDDFSAGAVQVISWDSRDSRDVDGLEIFGTVRNTGDGVVAAVQVEVTIHDENGDPLLDTQAFLKSPSLAPGRSTTFRAMLPGIYSLPGEPSFEVSSDDFSISRGGGNDDDDESARASSRASELGRDDLDGGG